MTWALIVVLVLTVALLAVGYYFMTVAVYPKVFTPEQVYKTEIDKKGFAAEELNSWPSQEVDLESRFGYRLRGAYFPIDGSQKTLVISHGITWSSLGMIQYIPMFRKHGFNVLVYDLRNHGRSGGKNTTFGFYEKYDLKTMVDWALAQLEPGGKVGTMGVSLGAVTSIQHAAIDPRLAFVIPECPFSDLQRLFAYRLNEEYHLPPFPLLNLGSLWSQMMTGMRFEAISPERDIQAIEAPVFLITTKGDNYVPWKMSVELYEHKTHGYRKLWLAPKGKHAQAWKENQAEYERQIDEFLQEIGMA